MKVLIVCGGTAGHIFPGLALAEELKREKDFCQIVMVVSNHPRDREFLMKGGGNLLKELHLETVGSISLPYSFSFKYILFVARLFWAFLKSFIIILRYAPQVVVGFGGYVSFAPLIIARIMGIPTIIHEQNLIPGRANRLLARITDRIAISFDDTNKFFARIGPHNKIIKTGLPLRKHILARSSFDIFDAKGSKFTILVVGGSQGAHNINELVLNCLNQMDEAALKHLQLIHLAGKKDFHYVKTRYEALGVASRVFDFLEDMAGAYTIADLLIGRSGASTIFEAAIFDLPCILIPYSGGTQHQEENAFYLGRSGAALVLDEETMSCKKLEKIIVGLIGNERLREDLSQKIRMFKTPHAAYNLKEQIFALYKLSELKS